jgi:hypothetical protein
MKVVLYLKIGKTHQIFVGVFLKLYWSQKDAYH